MKNKIELTIRKLIKEGILPSIGSFDITEDLLKSYVYHYGLGKGKLKSISEYGLARKLAAMNLMKVRAARGINNSLLKEGWVYLISNPAWPDHLKIGMTTDVSNRLNSYQTYDPLSLYKVNQYEFVMDRRRTEKNMLKTFNIHIETGEWIKYNISNDIMKCVRSNHWKL